MKRTTLMTILAMSLALGASRADVPAGTNKLEQDRSVAKGIQVAAEGVIAGNDPAERQPVQLTLPNADREKAPVLMAWGGGCRNCKNPAFSTWEQVRLALSVLYWI